MVGTVGIVDRYRSIGGMLTPLPFQVLLRKRVSNAGAPDLFDPPGNRCTYFSPHSALSPSGFSEDFR